MVLIGTIRFNSNQLIKSESKMVFNNYKGGQLANRIISFAHFIANSIEHQYKLVNMEFDEFEPYFESTASNDFKGYLISTIIYKNNFKSQLFRRSIRLWTDITNKFISHLPWYTLYRIFKTHDRKGIEFDLNNEQFIKDAQTKNVIAQGWGFRDHKNFAKHADILRMLFIPVVKHRDAVLELLSGIRGNTDLVYGIHIRRGDYSKFEGGKYFYSDEVYADKMMQLFEIASSQGKSCAFIICSNEQLQTTNFPEQLQLFTGARHPIVDMYALAACDGIIGPPSTFSGWASFYGKVPIQHIKSRDDLVQLGDYFQSV